MHRIRDLLKHRPAKGAPWLVQLDVRVKLLPTLVAIAAVVFSSKPWLPLGMFLVAAICWLAMRESLRSACAALAAPLALAAAAGVLKIFLAGKTPLAVFALGPFLLTATREGLADGLLTAARVLGSMGVILVFCRTTATHDIFSAMRWACVPQSVVEIAILMYRHVSTFLEHALDIRAAQQLRLGYAGVRRSLRSAASLSGMVLLRSFDQAQRTHEAMLARGYDGDLPIARLPAVRMRDVALLSAAITSIVLAWCVAERWPV